MTQHSIEVTVPREVLQVAGSMIRGHTSHYAGLERLIPPRHDAAMADGACSVCMLLAVIEEYLNPAEPLTCTTCGGSARRFDQATHDEVMRRTDRGPAMGQAIITCPDCQPRPVAVSDPPAPTEETT